MENRLNLLTGIFVRGNFDRTIALALIRIYKKMVSPFLPVSCRHMPTCSDYAYIAIKKFGVRRGIKLSARRLLRCRPYGTRGYDPVP